MPTLTIEAVPGEPGRPGQIKIICPDLQPAEAVVLLERAKAALVAQNVPALDGEPALIEQAQPGLARRLLNGK